MKNKRLFSLDIARAFAMIWIVGFWHASDYSPNIHDFLQEKSFSFVFSQLTATVLGTFMFISAYLLSSRNTFSTIAKTTNFFKKRVIRIVPLLAISMLSFPNSAFPYWDFLTKFLNLIGVAGYISFKLVPTLWFVSVLISFYVLLPFIASQKTIIRKILIATILQIIFIIGNEFNFVENRISLYFPAFALGIILSDYRVYILEKRKIFFQIATFLSVIYFGLMFIPFLRTTNYIGAFIGFFPLIAIAMCLETFEGKPIFVKLIKFFSYTSLVAYMFHRQIYIAFYHIGFPQDGVLRAAFIYVIILPVLFVSSYIIQIAYDKGIKFCYKIIEERNKP